MKSIHTNLSEVCASRGCAKRWNGSVERKSAPSC